MDYTKDFNTWNLRKQEMSQRKNFLKFKKCEIWWASVGVNVGHEIDGKHRYFECPVLIIKKISASSAFIVPLTSTIKENDANYVIYEINDEKKSANISQARMIDVRRLRRKFSYKLTNQDFVRILMAFKNQF